MTSFRRHPYKSLPDDRQAWVQIHIRPCIPRSPSVFQGCKAIPKPLKRPADKPTFCHVFPLLLLRTSCWFLYISSFQSSPKAFLLMSNLKMACTENQVAWKVSRLWAFSVCTTISNPCLSLQRINKWTTLAPIMPPNWAFKHVSVRRSQIRCSIYEYSHNIATVFKDDARELETYQSNIPAFTGTPHLQGLQNAQQGSQYY